LDVVVASYFLGAKGSKLFNFLLFVVVELHNSERNKAVLISNHSDVDMQHSLTFALIIGAHHHQCAIT